MTTMSNFPEDLIFEILSRIPLTSLRKVRSTCKTWNALSKIQVLGQKTAARRKHVLGFLVLGSTVCSLRFDLQGIIDEGDLVVPSIKKIRKFDKIKIHNVSHIDGLLFCIDKNRLVVWNPYLGQTRWIQRPKIFSGQCDIFAFGYDNNKNNRNHKILRILEECEYNDGDGDDLPDIFELYDFNSNSWRVLDAKPELYIVTDQFLSLKGNTYFLAVEEQFLLCFDFTTERFGPRLPMPYNYDADIVTLSCVREEQLAVLCQHEETMEIWITTKILPNALSWSKFWKVEMTPHNGFPYDFVDANSTESFFIDEEKKVVVAFDEYYEDKPTESLCYRGACIIGEDGYLKSMKLGKDTFSNIADGDGLNVPSLVQLPKQRGKRKRKVLSYPKRKKEGKKD